MNTQEGGNMKKPTGKIQQGNMKKLGEYGVLFLHYLEKLDPRHPFSRVKLEIELGPHGHYLVLQLKSIRRIMRKGLPIEYRTEILGDRWRGVAGAPVSYLPPKPNKVNAYSIHGEGDSRCYLAAYPVAASVPDFHQLNAFGPIKLNSRSE